MKKTEKQKNDRVFYITHSGELLFWLVVVLLFVGFISVSLIYKNKTENSYKIYLPDVDGLIVGSPVRIMGIEIGHVIKIKPIHDEVFVKFIIKDKNIKIPQGTRATVEFSGMAGSKSLELYPPDEKTYIDSTVPILTPTPPKRLHDAMGLLNEMFKELGSIIKTSSIFGKNLKTIEIPTSEKSGSIQSFLEFSDKTLDEANKRAENFEKRLKKDGK